MNASADPTLRAGARPYPTRAIVYPDGKVIERYAPLPMADITAIICDGTSFTGLDTINLRDGHVMLVHDLGHALDLPVNPGATAAYHAICVPGATHEIRGIAVIVPDEDFA